MKFPGAQYADIAAKGVAHIAPPGFPGDGLCRQMRCSRSGTRFAGIADGDFVFEWIDGIWHPRGKSFGPRAVIYRGEELLIRREGPAFGFRYIAPDGTPVTATDTYAHPSLPVWEFTRLPNGMIVGQGGMGPWGEDPAVIVLPNGTRKLVQTGMCRFIVAYLVGDRIDIVWQQDGRGCDARSLQVSDLASLPDAPAVVPPVIVPVPSIPTPEPVPMSIHLSDAVQATIRAVWPLVASLHAGDDAQRRAGTKAIIEQVVFSHPGQGYGWKASTPTNPPSKDAIAQQVGGRLYYLDLVDGTTRDLVDLGAEMEDITGQHFIPVSGVNHLGGGGPDPGDEDTPKPPQEPVPAPTCDCAKELKELAELRRHFEAVFELAHADYSKLADRVAALESRPAPVAVLPKLRVKGRTSREWSHAHTLDLEVVPE